MNKSESKYFNTALLMDKAFIRLLQAKDFEYISVKEICEKAGVNRSTFYLHYETIADLLEETTEYILSSFLSKFDRSPETFLSQIQTAPLEELVLIEEKFLTPYLAFIAENKSVLRAAFRNPDCLKCNTQFVNIKKHILIPILKRFNVPEDEQNYFISYYMSGITAIIKEWLDGGCKEPIEKIEKIIKNCVQTQNALVDTKGNKTADKK